MSQGGAQRENEPLLQQDQQDGRGVYKARVENLKSALRKWVTINEQRSMALQNSADESEKIKVASKVQQKLMGEMTGLIKQSDEKAREAEELVKKQKEALDQVESIGFGSMIGYFVVIFLVAGGLIAAWKLGLFSGGSDSPSPAPSPFIPAPAPISSVVTPSPSEAEATTSTPTPTTEPATETTAELSPPPPAPLPPPPPPPPPPPAASPSTSGFAGFLPAGTGSEASMLLETGQVELGGGTRGLSPTGPMTAEDYQALMPSFGDGFMKDVKWTKSTPSERASSKPAEHDYKFEFGQDVLHDIAE